jgi:hypothetical protein
VFVLLINNQNLQCSVVWYSSCPKNIIRTCVRLFKSFVLVWDCVNTIAVPIKRLHPIHGLFNTVVCDLLLPDEVGFISHSPAALTMSEENNDKQEGC